MYYFWFTDPTTGKRRQLSTKTSDKNEAKRRATEKLQEIIRCERPRTLRDITLSQFAQEYLEVRAGTLTRKTSKTIRDCFRQFEKRVGDVRLSTITVHDCERYIATGQPSVHTQRKHYGHLRAAFGRAVEWEYLATNPWERVQKPKAPQRETDYFRPTEFRNFVDSLPTSTYAERRFRNAVILSYETGMRLGEVRHLHRSAVSLQSRGLTVKNSDDFTTKSKKQRTVPLSQNAIAALRAQASDNYASPNEAVRESRYMFPSESGEALSEPAIGNLFAEHRKALFPDRKLSFHSLRHSFGTRLAERGVSPQMLQQLMGHSSITVTERYTHLRNMDLSPALALLDSDLPFDRPTVSSLDTDSVSYAFA